ncbi:MAG: thiazole synthase, partial [Kiritimatiellaeota bacterium]|nr:thiazole synthase [Kiritimatiellota bacterium]
MKQLEIAGTAFKSRLFLGTGKFSSPKALTEAIAASGTELVTVALKRVDAENPEDDILSAIGDSSRVMLNTSGARTAKEALRIARFAKTVGMEWIKLEIHPDPHHLLPDP